MAVIEGYEHWDALVKLINGAKASTERGEDLRTKLRSGSPGEVAAALDHAGVTMEVLGRIFDDLEVIADRNSLRYWSPLA